MPTARQTIDRTLAGYVRRRRFIAAGRSLLLAASAVATWCLLACVTDRFVGFNRPVRVGVVVIAAGLGTVLLGPVTRVFRRRFDAVTAAVEIENAVPTAAGKLATVVSKPVAGSSAAMLEVLTNQTAAGLPRRVRVSARPLLAPVAAVMFAAALVVTASDSPRLDLAGLVFRMIHPLTAMPAVTATRLTVATVPATTPIGQPLHVSCIAAPVDPSTVTLHVSDDAGRTWTRWPMTADADVPGKFSSTWAEVTSDLRLFITAGDAVSPTASVTASAKPVVLEYRSRIEPPKYLHKAAVNQNNPDGTIDAIEGSAVTTDLVCSRPVWQVRVQAGGHETVIAPAGDPAVVKYSFTVAGDQVMNLHVFGADGQIGDARPLTVHAQPDRPPAVRYVEASEFALVGSDGKADAAFEAADDLGVASVVTEPRVNDRRSAGSVKPFNGPKSVIVENAIDLKPLKVIAGDVVTVQLHVRDGRDQRTSSEVHLFLVVPDPVDVKSTRRLADLEAADAWCDRVGIDPAAEQNVKISLTRAAVDGPNSRWSAFVLGLAGKPAGAGRAGIKTLLNADRAADLGRLRSALGWLDRLPADDHANVAAIRHTARDRLVAKMSVESGRLGLAVDTGDFNDRLRGFATTAADLVKTAPADPVTIPMTPAIAAARPPLVPTGLRRVEQPDVPGYEDAVRLYLQRLHAAPGK